MKKRSVLFILSLLVLAANYIYTLTANKFGYPTPLGNKVAISNCQVKADLMGNFTNETIEMHTVDHNIKIIEATTLQGAVFGLGFVHATDRLWQLEFYRKLARGRLSEIFGKETLSVDKYVRTMGVPRMVENYLAIISDEQRLIVENYVAGVNKVAENLHYYPLEFYMFWQNFEPFTIEDSVAIQFLTTIFVSGDWFYEMVRERLLEVYSRDMVDRIFPF